MKSILKNICSPIQEVQNNLLQSKGIRLLIKRDDLIHPQVSGNKWRKLKYNVLAAKAKQQTTLLTFGGAFSNHIYATAAAGNLFGFKTIGLIRGERVKPLNPTLAYAEKVGMELRFISRTDYRKKENLIYQAALKKQFGNFFLVPEGGTNTNAIKGCIELVAEVNNQLAELPDYWCASCGTGGTLSGIIAGLNGQKKGIRFFCFKRRFSSKGYSGACASSIRHLGSVRYLRQLANQYSLSFRRLCQIQTRINRLHQYLQKGQ